MEVQEHFFNLAERMSRDPKWMHEILSKVTGDDLVDGFINISKKVNAMPNR